MKKAIIYDFDGVIVESEVNYINSVLVYLHRLGVSCSFDDISVEVGQTNDAIIDKLIMKFCLSKTHKEFQEESDSVFDELYSVDDFAPINGVIEHIKKCHELGMRQCIVSSNEKDEIHQVLSNFEIEQFFDFVLSSDDHFPSKPDPSAFSAAAERLGCPKDEIVIIEDSFSGVQAGVCSGIFTIGLKASAVKQDTTRADMEALSYEEVFDYLLRERSE